MKHSLHIDDLNLDKLYNETVVSNNGLANATDYLDYIIMNVLVLERTTQLLIVNVIIPNLADKLDPTDAGWIKDFYLTKVYTDSTKSLHLESAILLKEVCKKLLYHKYVYKNILSPVIPDTVTEPSDDSDDSSTPMDPNHPDVERYNYDSVMTIGPNEEPSIIKEYIGTNREIITTDIYSIDFPVLPDLPATADGPLPVFYKDTYYEALRLFSNTIANNTAQLTHNVPDLSIMLY